MPTFRYRSHLPYPRQEVFRWHLNPGALERLTPPWVNARIISREGSMDDGGTVVLGIRQGPAEMKWTARHTAYEDGRMFRDEQVQGPFGSWVHTHSFLEGDQGGCVMEDEVLWDPPFGAPGRLFGSGLVEREMERLFHFRHGRLRHDMDLHARYGGKGPMTVAISGASGLLGTALTHLLKGGGHKVLTMSRRKDQGDIHFDPLGGALDLEALEGVDGVVHLAGEPIFGLRWTQEKKDAIMESRRKGTELLARGMASLAKKPRVFVSASAVGIYGDRGTSVLTEEAAPGRGFLSRVCRAWEDATSAAQNKGIRTVMLRTGMVLTPAGGALGTMLLPFKMGIGGRLGSGRQYVSWIDLDDVTGLIYHALATDKLKGPMNVTAPHPVPNSTFTDTLGRVLGRPTLIPVPAFGVNALFGEMGKSLLLDGARVLPGKAEKTGYTFRYPTLEESLRFQLGKPETQAGESDRGLKQGQS